MVPGNIVSLCQYLDLDIILQLRTACRNGEMRYVLLRLLYEEVAFLYRQSRHFRDLANRRNMCARILSDIRLELMR